MRGLIRHLLALALVLAALTGLLRVVPRAVGFTAATVMLDSTGSYYPPTAPDHADPVFLICVPDPDPNSLTTGTNHTGNYFRCSNHWGTDVTLSWSTAGGGTATGISASGSATIAAGAQDQCVQTTLYADPAASGGSVRYRGTVDQSDLYAVIEFAGTLNVGGAGPSVCT